MNKNLIYFLLAIITLVASCRKDDDNAFDKSPDERLNETLQQYQAALSGSTYGWNANLTTADGGSYRFYFSFNESNRVEMYSDFDSTTATTIRESSYRLKALQQPSLIFDTYSYIHMLSDPDGAVSGGTYGQGLRSDFEFAIDTVTADSIRLTGRFNGSRLSLRKAAQGDRAVWASKQVTNGVVNFRNYWKIHLYFKRLVYAGTQYELQFDTTLKKVSVSWISGAQTNTVTRGYYFWANGVYFSDPIVNGSANIPGFSITSYNAGTQTMNVTVNGTAATIGGFTTPINSDVRNASNRWWQRSGSGDNYWISFDGWHVNGVDDAYNIKALKNDTADFYFILYKGNTNGADAFFTIYLDQAEQVLDVENGSWVTMNINTSNGLARFNEIDLRDPAVPWPATGAAAQTRSQMYQPNGYYFVQSSANTYDQVSVADPRIWITWYWLF
ncbi:DUF4302 domain-containing protein [Niastella populi]|uniref:DUF4302 domain-containing protein n=1 Tax=Niastella populi TaxID=550983 RepID=A0A1V9FRC5_9BACT|nr:DUF4302 domain-containing protein [Niastella populi]OQP60806.1 hypothetical protein A4R26_19580 [Niastella populi]